MLRYSRLMLTQLCVNHSRGCCENRKDWRSFNLQSIGESWKSWGVYFWKTTPVSSKYIWRANLHKGNLPGICFLDVLRLTYWFSVYQVSPWPLLSIPAPAGDALRGRAPHAAPLCAVPEHTPGALGTEAPPRSQHKGTSSSLLMLFTSWSPENISWTHRRKISKRRV